MKYKRNKLAILERNRKSILTNDLEHCYICDRPKDDMHEIYAGSNRQRSMIWNCCVPLCRKHHEEVEKNKNLNDMLHKQCQTKLEEQISREKFIEIFGKSYL